jgi:SAM-dependent methyltransferase
MTGSAELQPASSNIMTDWENCYQTNQIFWDKGAPAPVLSVLVGQRPEFFQTAVLVPGCGFGHDARFLAASGAKVTAVDIAPTAVKKARELDAAGTVNFHEADLFNLPADLRRTFDIVWEHTCLSAMPPNLRHQYAQGLASALKPGGIIAGVFYINPDLDPGETGPPFPISPEQVIELWASVGYEVQEQWVPEVAYPGREGRECFMLFKQK